MKTSDIEIELKRAEFFDSELITSNPAPKYSDVIDALLEEKGLKRSDIIRELNYDRTYGYQILNGTRVPTKKQIIEIALFIGITTEQLQQLLKICGREVLYARNIEDAKVMYALEHSYTYEKAVEFVWGGEY